MLRYNRAINELKDLLVQEMLSKRQYGGPEDGDFDRDAMMVTYKQGGVDKIGYLNVDAIVNQVAANIISKKVDSEFGNISPEKIRYGSGLSSFASTVASAANTAASSIKQVAQMTGNALGGLANMAIMGATRGAQASATVQTKAVETGTTGVIRALVPGVVGDMLTKGAHAMGQSLTWAINNPAAAAAAAAAAGIISGAISGEPLRRVSEKVLPTAMYRNMERGGMFKRASAASHLAMAGGHALMGMNAYGGAMLLTSQAAKEAIKNTIDAAAGIGVNPMSWVNAIYKAGSGLVQPGTTALLAGREMGTGVLHGSLAAYNAAKGLTLGARNLYDYATEEIPVVEEKKKPIPKRVKSRITNKRHKIARSWSPHRTTSRSRRYW